MVELGLSTCCQLKVFFYLQKGKVSVQNTVYNEVSALARLILLIFYENLLIETEKSTGVRIKRFELREHFWAFPRDK